MHNLPQGRYKQVAECSNGFIFRPGLCAGGGTSSRLVRLQWKCRLAARYESLLSSPRQRKGGARVRLRPCHQVSGIGSSWQFLMDSLSLDDQQTYQTLHHGFGSCRILKCRLLGEDRVDSNTQTLMAGEDFAFIARCGRVSLCSASVAGGFITLCLHCRLPRPEPFLLPRH